MEKGRRRKDPATEEWLHTCTIITGEPNELVAQIHTRMPVILAEEHHEAWLTNQAGKEVLTPFPAGAMRCDDCAKESAPPFSGAPKKREFTHTLARGGLLDSRFSINVGPFSYCPRSSDRRRVMILFWRKPTAPCHRWRCVPSRVTHLPRATKRQNCSALTVQ